MVTTLWSNWARTEIARPARTVAPRDVEELAAAVAAAHGEGLRVKAVGSGHSFTGIAVTDGLLVDMSGLDGVVGVDRAGGLVTVEAGVTIRRLNQILDAHGLALENMGDIDRQTISGAISTGTHGTGARYGGLATQLRALDLVGPDGTITHCSPTERPELFAAARVGLGALGVISRVTLQCVPAFALRAVETPMRLPEVFDRLPQLIEDHDHFEFYWFPHTLHALTKCNTRLRPDGGPRPPKRLAYWWHEGFTANTLFEASNRVGTRFPRAVPGLNGLAGRVLSARDYTDVSHRVFTSPRTVVFREMEYAIPREAVGEALAGIQRWLELSGAHISFPLEIRFAAADEVWLSTAHGRDVAYIAVHQYHRHPYEQYFRAAADIFDSFDGRPHWGKIHWLDHEALRVRYERFDDFLAVRDQVDPSRTFANKYLEQVFGG